MITINNVTVQVDYKYVKVVHEEYEEQSKVEILRLKIPLPGGEAIYEFPITKEQRESLELASKLSTTC